ncbi:MAG: hypothetical protein K6F48_06995 [Paludibacteraceae bacterium]|nr:hypothetical protein [Paludibacteraceae bacterium]
MKRTLIRLIIFICAICCASSSYSQLPMGSWQTFFSYNHVGNLTQSKDKVYILSSGNLFSVDKEYESIETYTKLTGLTDGNISKIAYCQSRNTLVIVYENCNIDLLNGSHVTNINDLKRTEMSNKKVNDITISGKYAYLACGFGIVVIDLEREEVADTYILGEGGRYLNVEKVVFLNDSIYAQSGNTIRYAYQKDDNLADFNHWKNFYIYSNKADNTQISDLDSLNVDSLINEGELLSVSKISSFGKSMLFCSNNVLYKKDSVLTPIRPISSSAHISVGERMVISENGSMVVYNSNLDTVAEISTDSILEAIYDPQSKAYWASACQEDGQSLLRKYGEDGSFINQYIPKGPMSGEIAFVKYLNGNLYTGSGGPFDRPLATPGVIQTLIGNRWSIITEQGMDSTILKDKNFLDVLDIAVDPKDPDHFFASTWKGLFEFQGVTLINHYDERNTPIHADGENTIVDGLKYDNDGNLWMMNILSHIPIHVLTPNKEWISLIYPRILNQEGLRDLFLDSRGYLWVILYRKGPGVFCADLNGTPLNSNDDKSVFLSVFQDKSSNALIPTTVRAIAEDMDGVIWIGTDKGPVLISDASKVFDSDFKVDRIKITREDNPNYADYLLENEQINAIAIDGSNRKWIGTNSTGLYLLSPDGKETIHHFTTENSPFTSNTIMDLSIDNETGGIFIATSTGLFLYQSDATKGSESYKKVYVYPNPVRETYTGPISIMGLLENSQVRISDSEGRIIHEGNSNGGTYVWDGKDLNGRKVNTGIYFIYAALSDGSSKMVTKIAIIR